MNPFKLYTCTAKSLALHLQTISLLSGWDTDEEQQAKNNEKAYRNIVKLNRAQDYALRREINSPRRKKGESEVEWVIQK